jgi:crossover junction endodeoxyribonuclease RuvC
MTTSNQSYASIDPGVSGAIAIFSYVGQLQHLVDMPTIQTTKGKSKKGAVLDRAAIVDLLLLHAVDHVFIELSQARPARRGGQSVTPGIVSTGSYMRNYGILVGICAGLQIRCTEITPAKWKRKVMSGMSKDKGASIIRASELYPEIRLIRKKNHNNADAVLIGWYAATEILRIFANSNVIELKAAIPGTATQKGR